jgi:hypothetical protein
MPVFARGRVVALSATWEDVQTVVIVRTDADTAKSSTILARTLELASVKMRPIFLDDLYQALIRAVHE